MISKFTLARMQFASAVGKKKVGFLGLGNMGCPMAVNLKKSGFEVKGFDLGERQCHKASEEGILVQKSLADTVRDADFIVCALSRTENVDMAMKSKGGVFDTAKKGAIICDASTINPVASVELAKQAPEHDLIFMDTPMSGGVPAATGGTLTFMVGGSEEHFELSKEVLNGMGAKIFHAGPSGNGGIAKIVNNLILGITMVGVSEAFAIGEKLGADPKLLQEICAVSSARSWVMDTYHPRPGVIEGIPSSKGYEGGFGVSLMKKDMALALDAANHVDQDHTMTDLTIQYYQMLEKQGFGGKDFSYVFQYIMKNKQF